VIAQQQDAGRLPSEKRPVVVFFSIFAAQRRCPNDEPDEIAKLLTEYFTEMVDKSSSTVALSTSSWATRIMALWAHPLPTKTTPTAPCSAPSVSWTELES